MNKSEKKESLSELIAIKTTPTMKNYLKELSEIARREFSDYLRFEWDNLISKGIKEKKIKKRM